MFLYLFGIFSGVFLCILGAWFYTIMNGREERDNDYYY